MPKSEVTKAAFEKLVPFKSGPARLSLPCILNRGSMGSAEFTYVMLERIYEAESKLEGGCVLGWFPRKDVTILEQPLINEELLARLEVPIVEERPKEWVVELHCLTNGKRIIRIPQPAESRCHKVASA